MGLYKILTDKEKEKERYIMDGRVIVGPDYFYCCEFDIEELVDELNKNREYLEKLIKEKEYGF